eukprot:TRINITY_DN1416_c2_g1_i1.p1 TRINITY_DN1416_c2_g1~~TRINITY_DN1416_c2_g1_i1.p1  ORF type:complete len:404 (-),score=22.31 TRINITY_DN1416_c2_g1_i1:76-1287(-)
MNVSFTEETTEVYRIIEVIGRITLLLNYANTLPNGILAPVISFFAFLYTIAGLIKTRRCYRAELIIYNITSCSEEELTLRRLNYSINMTKYKLMLIVCLLELCCILIPVGPYVITLVVSQHEFHERIERFASKCGSDIVLKLMTHNLPSRLYVAFCKAAILAFFASLRVLLVYLTNVYRERLKYNNFRKHFLHLALKLMYLIPFDIMRYTFIPNLFIYIVILLWEYVLLWKALKDLRWATKWKLIDLERDYPSQVITINFRMGTKLYRIVSYLLSIGIFFLIISILSLFNIRPIFDLVTHPNCYIHEVYPISPSYELPAEFIDISTEYLIISLITLLENIFVVLVTFILVYPNAAFFLVLVIATVINWFKKRNTGYPTRRPELITQLLAWHRGGYASRHMFYD